VQFFFIRVVYSGPFIPACSVSTILVFAAPNSTAKRPDVRRTVRVDVRRQTFSAPVRVQCRRYNSSCIQPLERMISSTTGRQTLLYIHTIVFVCLHVAVLLLANRTCSAYPRPYIRRWQTSLLIFFVVGVLQPSDDALRFFRWVWCSAVDFSKNRFLFFYRRPYCTLFNGHNIISHR